MYLILSKYDLENQIHEMNKSSNNNNNVSLFTDTFFNVIPLFF